MTELKQKQQLTDVIRHACSGWAIGSQAYQHVFNHLRVAFQVARWEDIPTEQFDAAMLMVRSKRESKEQYLRFLAEAREWFDKNVLGGGVPWTPAIRREYFKLLGRQVILPPKVDWLALAHEVKVLRNKEKQS